MSDAFPRIIVPKAHGSILFIYGVNIVFNNRQIHSQIDIVCNRQIKPKCTGLQRYEHDLRVYSVGNRR